MEFASELLSTEKLQKRTSCFGVLFTSKWALRLLVTIFVFGGIVSMIPAGNLRFAPKVYASTTCGSVKGLLLNGKGPNSEVKFAAFRGLPFGAPTDKPRWQPPREAECWESGEVFDATRYGHQCMQWFPGFPAGATAFLLGMSEDCLNLDLYTPALRTIGNRHEVESSAALPIVVWIPGGGNFVASSQLYGPIQNLVPMSGGRAVLVSLNYRTNVLGFGALPELSAADPRGTSGNYGLLDIQLALQWVRQNGHRFGGDTKRVTLLGQSAGGSNILAMYAMPSNIRRDGPLFHAAISLSGAPALYTNVSAKHAQDRDGWVANTPCADHVGADLLTCLRGLSFAELVSKLPQEWSQSGNTFPTSSSHLGYPDGGVMKYWRSWAHVDGVTVTQSSLLAFKDGPVIRASPLLMQSMNAEDSPSNFCALTGVGCDRVGKATSPFKYTVNMLHEFWSDFLKPGFGDGVGDALFNMYYANKSTLDPAVAYWAADSDTALACGHIALADAAASSNKSAKDVLIYVSVVESQPDPPIRSFPCTGTEGNKLAFHGWDLTMALNLYEWDHRVDMTIQQAGCPYKPSESTSRFGRLLLEQWLHMAEFQRLNASSSGWGHYDAERKTLGIFQGGSVKAVEHGKQNICNWWKAKGVGEQWWWI